MRDKAYVVINNEQEQYILSKFGKKGIKWISSTLATDFKTKKDKDGGLTVISYKEGKGISYFYLVNEHMLDDMDVEFDGRKEDIMTGKDKAYIVTNKEQELRVLTKLEQEGYTWFGSGNDKPTEYIPSKYFITGEHFPIAITNDLHKRITIDSRYEYLNDEHYNIIYDGREEEAVNPKMKISKEVYDALMEWRNVINKSQFNNFVGKLAINKMDGVIYNWWSTGEIDDKEGNNRLIAIIRWVNGEDVFKVEKPKKWVVRSKEPQGSVDGEPLYIWFVDELTLETETEANMPPYIRRFNTKEEAESWVNSHQEVIEVEE